MREGTVRIVVNGEAYEFPWREVFAVITQKKGAGMVTDIHLRSSDTIIPIVGMDRDAVYAWLDAHYHPKLAAS